MIKICLQCKNNFKAFHGKRDKFCSQKCYGESRRLRFSGSNNPFFGKIHTEQTKNKIKLFKKGKRQSISTEFKKNQKPWNYIKDRSLLKKQNKRNDSAYYEWRLKVWLRDNFKCKMANLDCKGRIEAHHILSWSDYPELRYKINNGITLCQAHHPLKRAEEKRLFPVFQELVSVSN